MKKSESHDISEKDLDKKINSHEINPIHIPKIVTLSDVVKYQFCSEIIKYKKMQNLKQQDLSILFDINKSEVSKICAYNLKLFSQERLMGFVETLISKGANIDLQELWEKIKIQSKKIQRNLKNINSDNLSRKNIASTR